jgi:hypothetical protein
MRFNFIDYLRDAKFGISETAEKSSKWLYNYDTLSCSKNSDNNQRLNLSDQNIDEKSSSLALSPPNTNKNNNDNNNNNNTNNLMFQELENDPDEFLFNLKINSTSLDIDPATNLGAKSARSTMNIFTTNTPTVNKELNEDIIDDEVYTSSLSEKKSSKMNNSGTSNHNSNKTKASKKKEKKKHSKESNSSKTVTKRSSKTNKSHTNNNNNNNRLSRDFYVLAFDNELSSEDAESSNSTSSSTSSSSSSTSSVSYISNGEGEGGNEEDNYEDNDDSITSTSFASNATINNNNINNDLKSLSSKKSDKQLDFNISLEMRKKLVDYLYLNEMNHHNMLLNDGLNEFLLGIDRFFLESDLKAFNNRKMKHKEVNSFFDKLDKMYDSIIKLGQEKNQKEEHSVNIVVKEPLSPSSSSTTSSDNQNNQIKVDAVSINLTAFPAYNGNDSFDSSSDSVNTNSQAAIDSGIESTKDFNKEAGQNPTTNNNMNDIGPFLNAVLMRLDLMLNNSLEINLLVTGLVGRLAYYPQLLIRSFLLNPDNSSVSALLQPNVKNLLQVLCSLKQRMESQARNCNNFSLLYLKAKLNLIKRVMIHSGIKSNSLLLQQQHNVQNDLNLINQSLTSLSSVQTTPTNNNQSNPRKKSSSSSSPFVRKILDIFKPKNETTTNSSQQEHFNMTPVQQKQNQNVQLIQNKAFKIDYIDALESSASLPSTYGYEGDSYAFGDQSCKSLNISVNAAADSLTSPQVELDLNDVKTK